VTLNGSHEVAMQQESVKVEMDYSNSARHFKPGFPYRGQVIVAYNMIANPFNYTIQIVTVVEVTIGHRCKKRFLCFL